MMNRRILLGSTSALLVQALLSHAQTAGGGKLVFAHRHPGITIAYVLEGEVRSKVGDDPETLYTTGQMFLETPNQLHAVSRNASTTKPARLLAVMLVEKGKQLTTPA